MEKLSLYGSYNTWPVNIWQLNG